MAVPRTEELGTHARDFADDERLNGLLERCEPAGGRVREALAQGLEKEPLTVEETTVLLRTDE